MCVFVDGHAGVSVEAWPIASTGRSTLTCVVGSDGGSGASWPFRAHPRSCASFPSEAFAEAF